MGRADSSPHFPICIIKRDINMWSFGNDQEHQEQTEDKYKEDKEKLFKEIDEKRQEIFDLVDQYSDSDVSGDLKELISKGFQIYVGGRVVNFEVTDVEELPADRLKEDVKQQFRQKLEQIKESINEKLYSLSESYESIREKLDDELQKAKDTNNVVPMPDVYERHAAKGLSVVRGNSNDELIWLYNGYYYVKTVDNKPISDELRKSTIKPVTVRICTRGSRVTSVKLKRFNTLNNFKHYHSMDGGSTDCWGDWDYSIKWTSPEDIIELGKDALSILTDVNSDSPGTTEPSGLPKLDVLIRNSRGQDENRINGESTDEPEIGPEPEALDLFENDSNRQDSSIWTA